MINKVILLGNLGKDAELKGEGDRSFLSLSVATEDGYFDKQNKWVSVTEWHSVKVFGKAAIRHAELKKGAKIYVEGKIKSSPKKDSTERYYQIIAEKIKTLSKPASTPSVAPKPVTKDDFGDDIPF